MKNELVVKDNALINASYNLELTEQRLVLLAIVHSRKTGHGISAESKLEIHASDYMQQFNVDKHAAYKAMKDAATNLFERKFSFSQHYKSTNKIENVKSRWVSQISYVEDLAILTITFSPAVVPLITKLEQHFTSYKLKQISQLTSKYAVRLYELLIAWREIEKTPPMEIADFRERLGLKETEYTAMNNFKNRVLEPAIKQINEHTDIIVQYDQQKRARTITGFQFKFKQKPIIDMPIITDAKAVKLTEKQIQFFANKLAYDDTFASKYAEVGEEYGALEKRLIKNLSDDEFIKKYSKDLERVGFKLKDN